jgi:hypothetical protein
MKLALATETFGNQNHRWLGSARGLESTRTAVLKVAALTAGTHFPNGYLPDGLPLALATSGTYSGFFVPMAARASEVQTVTLGGTTLGVTYTLTLEGQTTGAIAFDATAAAVQAALDLLSNVNPGDVVVTGSSGASGGVYTLTFGGARSGQDVPALTYTSSLTGTNPTITIATATAGGPAASDGSNVLAGFLAYPISVLSTDVTVSGALLDSGKVIVAKLPIALSAAQRATNSQFIWL